VLAHWQEAFLEALRRTGNVNLSAELAGRPRSTVYYHREQNREFEKAWDRALKLHAESNTRRAIRRTLLTI